MQGNFEVCRNMLLMGNANVNGRNQHGWNALHCAAGSGNGDLCMLLLECDADAVGKDHNGDRPCDVAAHAGHKGLARFLTDAAKEQQYWRKMNGFA